MTSATVRLEGVMGCNRKQQTCPFPGRKCRECEMGVQCTGLPYSLQCVTCARLDCIFNKAQTPQPHQDYLKALFDAANDICAKAKDHDKEFGNMPINYGDFRCISANLVERCCGDDFDKSYEVVLSEASPSLTGEFYTWFSKELSQVGFADIEIRTEW